MDSKYSIGTKNGNGSSAPHLKRKFSYGSATTVPPKRPNLQPSFKGSPSTLKHVPSTSNNSSNDRTIVKDIQQQRKLLPVHAVREPYVDLTTLHKIVEFKLIFLIFCFCFLFFIESGL